MVMNINEKFLDIALATSITNTDSYKFTHYRQTPEGTTNAFSYIESRGTKLDWDSPRIMMFGLQIFLREYMTTKVTHEDIDIVKPLVEAHGFEFNEAGWRHIVDEHDGVLPLRIRAVKEGTVMPLSNIMVSVEATDPKCYWLPPYVETMILRGVWYPCSVATNSFRAKEIIKRYLDKTSVNGDAELPFKLHDFGARGGSSNETIRIGGAAHLVNFMGTDTFQAALYAMKHYNTKNMPGFSINAAEHFTITTWGKENEAKAYKNMLNKFAGPGKIVAVVSDSYDIYNAVSHIWGEELKDDVVNSGGTVVIRPDSGNPLTVPLEVIELLMEKFGHVVNDKGYRVLPDYIRVIQGDGITVDNIEEILKRMEAAKLSASNIAFGMGGGLLQMVDRDTYKYAMKCSAREHRGNEWTDVFKDPVTDKGKMSKKGRLTLVKDTVTGEFRTVRFTDPVKDTELNVMRTVYLNGVKESEFQTFEEVRAEAEKYLT
jgi:nicotinamide phosphoribosyltransferase